MWQSAGDQVDQAYREADALTLTLADQLAGGRINETFTASLDEEGYVISSGRAPTTKHQIMLMMTVRRLMTMDKQDDGTLSIKLDSAALRAAADKIRAAAQHAQGEAAKLQTLKDARAQRETAAAAQREIDAERRGRIATRLLIKSGF